MACEWPVGRRCKWSHSHGRRRAQSDGTRMCADDPCAWPCRLAAAWLVLNCRDCSAVGSPPLLSPDYMLPGSAGTVPHLDFPSDEAVAVSAAESCPRPRVVCMACQPASSAVPRLRARRARLRERLWLVLRERGHASCSRPRWPALQRPALSGRRLSSRACR